MPHVDLLELPYFEGISIDDLVALVELLEPRRFAAGDVIVTEGDTAPTPLYIATSGRVLLCKKTGADGQRNLAELDSPTLFGEIELFCQLPAVATAKALTTVTCFALNHATFERLFLAHQPALMRFIFNVARVACHRLAIADEMMTRFLPSEDLARLRRAVFTVMNTDHDWPQKTGCFTRPRAPQAP